MELDHVYGELTNRNQVMKDVLCGLHFLRLLLMAEEVVLDDL